MMYTNYKKEAQNLYRSNKPLEAYQCAWQLPFNDFVLWFTKEWNRKPSKSISFFNDPFFYNSFLTTQSTEWLNHREAILLWEYYLKSQNDIALDFELYVAYNNPSLFIEGYKTRLVFLNDKRLKQIQKQNLPLSIKNELKIWNKFNSLLNLKWNEAKRLMEEMNLAPYELCMYLCAAFEAYIYKNQDDKLHWHYAVETLSLLIAYIQNKYDLANLEVDEITLNKAYYGGVINSNWETIFNETFDYVLLREKTQRYAYEPGLNVVIDADDNDILNFKESDVFNKQ